MKKSYMVFGKEIKVVIKAGVTAETGFVGYYEPHAYRIVLDKSLNKKDRYSTLLHELGHALFHRAGLMQGIRAKELEEIIVEQFSIMFSENFKQT